MPDIGGEMQASGELAGALQDMLRKMLDKIIGAPGKGKNGEPLRDLCVMIMQQGMPIEPRDFAYPWDPAGGDVDAESADDSKAAVPGAPAPSADAVAAKARLALEQAFKAAGNTSLIFDQMLRVTDDGSFRPFTSSGGRISTAYEAIITKAQGIPAPPPPADIQKKIDEAMRVLYVFDDKGVQKGKTKAFKDYQSGKLDYESAEADYANAYAAGMGNAALGSVLPVTLKALKAAVDNAYDNWRSNGADVIENALETVESQGGSIGNHFLAQGRELYKAWDLGLTGSVPVGTPYTKVLPSTWYDPLDKDNGFTVLSASASSYSTYGSSQSAQHASSWYKGHSQSTSAGGGAMIFGVMIGGSGGSGESDSQSGSEGSGSSYTHVGSSVSNVSIKFDFGLCTIYRPWLLRELFAIDGWYLPGEAKGVISDGTIGGQKGDDDKHLLSMIPTQFLVVRNVEMTADHWGSSGTQMAGYCRQATADGRSSNSKVSGGIGFLCMGGTVSHENADWSGESQESGSSYNSWYFAGDAEHGKLFINGCQIVGYIGEIVPVSPRSDEADAKKALAAIDAAAGKA